MGVLLVMMYWTLKLFRNTIPVHKE